MMIHKQKQRIKGSALESTLVKGWTPIYAVALWYTNLDLNHYAVALWYTNIDLTH